MRCVWFGFVFLSLCFTSHSQYYSYQVFTKSQCLYPFSLSGSLYNSNGFPYQLPSVCVSCSNVGIQCRSFLGELVASAVNGAPASETTVLQNTLCSVSYSFQLASQETFITCSDLQPNASPTALVVLFNLGGTATTVRVSSIIPYWMSAAIDGGGYPFAYMTVAASNGAPRYLAAIDTTVGVTPYFQPVTITATSGVCTNPWRLTVHPVLQFITGRNVSPSVVVMCTEGVAIVRPNVVTGYPATTTFTASLLLSYATTPCNLVWFSSDALTSILYVLCGPSTIYTYDAHGNPLSSLTIPSSCSVPTSIKATGSVIGGVFVLCGGSLNALGGTSVLFMNATTAFTLVDSTLCGAGGIFGIETIQGVDSFEHVVLKVPHVYVMCASGGVSDVYIGCVLGAGNVGNSMMCQWCPSGTYNSVLGVPTMSVNPLSVTCLNCSIGRYNPYNSSVSVSACMECGAGTYGDQSGLSSCTLCHAGTYNPLTFSTSASACISCPMGTYNPLQGSFSATACVTCAAGSYNSVTGVSVCALCAPGTYSLTVGATDNSTCVACSAGRFSSIAGQSQPQACQDCLPGSYSPAQSSACLLCSPGYFSVSLSATCSPCSPGTYQSMPGASSCTPCAPNTFGATPGANSSSTCHQCAPGSTSSQGASSCTSPTCADGLYLDKATASCVPCQVGHYCLGGVSSPSPCGSFVSTVGESSFTRCPPGSYIAVTGAISGCAPCPSSTFCSTNGCCGCSLCPLGTASVVTGAASQSSCTAIYNSTSSASFAEFASMFPISYDQLLLPASQYPSNVSFFSVITNVSEQLRSAGAILNDVPSQATPSSGVSDARVSWNITLLVIICLCGVSLLPLFLHRLFPPKMLIFDLFEESHNREPLDYVQNLPSQIGCAFTISFVLLAAAVAFTLSVASNAITTSTFIPATSVLSTTGITVNDVVGDFFLSIRAFSANGDSCTTTTNSMTPYISVTSSGWSSTLSVNTLFVAMQSASSYCLITVDCRSCSLVNPNVVQFQLPWHFQSFEWQISSSSPIASSTSLSGVYGIVRPLLTDPPLQGQLSLELDCFLSIYKNDVSYLSASPAVYTGHELSFSQFNRASQTGAGAALLPAANVSITSTSSFSLTVSLTLANVIFYTSSAHQLTLLQLIASILSVVVSILSVFKLVFPKLERMICKSAKKQDEASHDHVFKRKTRAPKRVAKNAKAVSNEHENEGEIELPSFPQKSQVTIHDAIDHELEL